MLFTVGLVSIVTVSPFLIVTSSPAPGTPNAPEHPASQVVGRLQFPPPTPLDVHATSGLSARALLLAKIVEDQRSEIRGRRSVAAACAGGLIHACSLNHDKDPAATAGG